MKQSSQSKMIAIRSNQTERNGHGSVQTPDIVNLTCFKVFVVECGFGWLANQRSGGGGDDRGYYVCVSQCAITLTFIYYVYEDDNI